MFVCCCCLFSDCLLVLVVYVWWFSSSSSSIVVVVVVVFINLSVRCVANGCCCLNLQQRGGLASCPTTFTLPLCVSTTVTRSVAAVRAVCTSDTTGWAQR